MVDSIETVGKGSLIQHGKLNDRIYLMKLKKEDCPEILQSLCKIAKENNYSKVFCKVPEWAAPFFLSDGYQTEAYIPKFFKGRESAFFLSKYLDLSRLNTVEKTRLIELGKLLRTDRSEFRQIKDAIAQVKIKELNSSHMDQITEIFKKVFISYPFPIFNRNYLEKTLLENVRYFGAEKLGKLIAVASAEIDLENCNAEMTDFATLPEYRGLNLAQLLLSRMEEEMKVQKMKTLYTIARLNSNAMNKTFLRQKFSYCGTLLKNTNISGEIESMNVFYKHI